jgi:hypothetical protein
MFKINIIQLKLLASVGFRYAIAAPKIVGTKLAGMIKKTEEK